jgi:hypothetical protein
MLYTAAATHYTYYHLCPIINACHQPPRASRSWTRSSTAGLAACTQQQFHAWLAPGASDCWLLEGCPVQGRLFDLYAARAVLSA